MFIILETSLAYIHWSQWKPYTFFESHTVICSNLHAWGNWLNFFYIFFSFELYMWDYGKMKKLKWIICFFDIIFRCTIFKIRSLRFPDSFVHFYCGVSEANVICLLSQCRNMFSMKIAVFIYLCTVVYWWHNYVANHNQDKCKQKPFQLLVIPFNEYFCTL